MTNYTEEAIKDVMRADVVDGEIRRKFAKETFNYKVLSSVTKCIEEGRSLKYDESLSMYFRYDDALYLSVSCILQGQSSSTCQFTILCSQQTTFRASRGDVNAKLCPTDCLLPELYARYLNNLSQI